MPQYRYSAEDSTHELLLARAAELGLSESAMLTLMIRAWKSPFGGQSMEQPDVKPSKPAKAGSLTDVVARYKEKNQ